MPEWWVIEKRNLWEESVAGNHDEHGDQQRGGHHEGEREEGGGEVEEAAGEDLETAARYQDPPPTQLLRQEPRHQEANTGSQPPNAGWQIERR